jgi:O-antigen/teichoic acid export membrane protein
MADQPNTVAGKILHNSFWYGLEQALEVVVFFGTTITVARYFGPDKLGYFVLINFFVNVITSTSQSGLAGVTRKYMSEFLGLDRLGTARAVYNLAFRYQLLAGLAIATVGILGVVLFGDSQYRIMSSILILSIVPGMMSSVTSQANLAFEDAYANTFSAIFYIFTSALIIVLTLCFHWDLIGIASAQLTGRLIEAVIRSTNLHKRLSKLPIDVLEREIVQRIRRFCLQAVAVQLLMSVVWDRSELIFLKHFSTLRQLAFYSVSFTATNNMLVIPRIFGSSTGVSLMVESARDPAKVKSIVRNAARILLLVAIPVHLGAAAIAAQALAFAYGQKYLGAIPVLFIAAILSLPRAFQEMPEVLLRAADRQRQILTWYSITGILNLALDWYLIQRYGAVGAAWGNGLAQTFGIVVIWIQARRFYNFSFPAWTAIRLLAAGLGMAAVAWFVVRSLPGIAGLIAAVLSAAVVYILLVKLLRGLDSSDRDLLAPIGNRLPTPLRRAFLAVLTFATPATT